MSPCGRWWPSWRNVASKSATSRCGTSSSTKASASKKSLRASEQDRADVARRRAQWKKYQGRLDPARLVFIDETWAKTNMTRSHGRCARGARLVAKVPHGRWRTLTFLAALRCDRIDAPCVIDGPINGESFLAYVEQVLVPALKPGDIVIIDNLGSHKGKAVQRGGCVRHSRERVLPFVQTFAEQVEARRCLPDHFGGIVRYRDHCFGFGELGRLGSGREQRRRNETQACSD